MAPTITTFISSALFPSTPESNQAKRRQRKPKGRQCPSREEGATSSARRREIFASLPNHSIKPRSPAFPQEEKLPGEVSPIPKNRLQKEPQVLCHPWPRRSLSVCMQSCQQLFDDESMDGPLDAHLTPKSGSPPIPTTPANQKTPTKGTKRPQKPPHQVVKPKRWVAPIGKGGWHQLGKTP